MKGAQAAAIDPGRTFPRLSRSLRILLPDGWIGEVIDLSAAGMKIESIALLPIGTELVGELEMPDRSRVPFKAAVVWATPPEHELRVPAQMGLLLLEMSDEYRRAIAELFA